MQVVLFVLFAFAGIWALYGLWTGLTSSAVYRITGAAWGAVKFFVLGGCAVFAIYMVVWAIIEKVQGSVTPESAANSKVNAWLLYAMLGLFMLIGCYGAWQGWMNATMSTSIPDIIADQSYYDGNGVYLSGRIAAYQQHMSRIGNRYVTATLCDGGKCIRVFEWGDADDSAASTGWAQVWGTYRTVNRVGEYAFSNEIVANDISSVEAPSTDDSGP